MSRRVSAPRPRSTPLSNTPSSTSPQRQRSMSDPATDRRARDHGDGGLSPAQTRVAQNAGQFAQLSGNQPAPANRAPAPPPPPSADARAAIDARHAAADAGDYQATLRRGERALDRMQHRSDGDRFGQAYQASQYQSGWEGGGADRVMVTRHPQLMRDESYRYENVPDPVNGRIVAKHNKKDRQVEQVPSSEVLFQQYKQAAEEQDQPLANFPLRTLERSNVISGNLNPNREVTPGSGMAVMNHVRRAYPNETRFGPGHEAYRALMGTDNAVSAVGLVKDHGQELGISGIREVELTQQGFNIHFAPAPQG